jgi:uncharacterized protein (DUF1501 family)
MNRRHFITCAGLGTLSAFAQNSWLGINAAPGSNPRRLIVIFLRGAVDGLNVVVPYNDPNYYQYRPKIAIPKPGSPDGALDLDGRFGLHPAMAPILPLWQQGSLAFVHASGLTKEVRSHFDAQYYMETGVPGVGRQQDGWLNRLLTEANNKSPLQAISISSTMPQILKGKMPVTSIGSTRQAGNQQPIDRQEVSTAFDQLYNSTNIKILGRTYRSGRVARTQLLKDLETEMKMANNGAPLPTGFAAETRSLARLMVKDDRIQVAFLQLGGWDTHINQGNSKGLLAKNLGELTKGLATLQQELGDLYGHTQLVVMSEFGRTAKENGNGGTDHGHGNVMWLLGGATKGGKVYGQWPGLAPEQLYQGRDLNVTTDFREPIAKILTNHLGLNTASSAKILPNFSPNINWSPIG